MESKTLLRRVEENDKYNLLIKLSILLRNHKESKYMCSATSIAYRVAGLCELAITGYLEINDGVVKVVKSHPNGILNDFLIKVAQINDKPTMLINELNGEKAKQNSIKHLKSRVYKEVESLNIIKRKKGVINNKIYLKDNIIWKNIFDRIVDECMDNRVSIKTRVILLCLEYINNMHDILIQLPENKATAVVSTMVETRNMLINDNWPKEYNLVFLFMKYLCKCKFVL